MLNVKSDKRAQLRKRRVGPWGGGGRQLGEGNAGGGVTYKQEVWQQKVHQGAACVPAEPAGPAEAGSHLSDDVSVVSTG